MFAIQIQNTQPMQISPGQSTQRVNFGVRAFIESFELIDFIVYLFG